MSDAEDRPWEKYGAVRRDALPHRGGLLYRLSLFAFFAAFVGPLSLISLPISVTIAILAHGDLAAIQRGELDPEGRLQTGLARTLAVVGIFIGTLSLLICVALELKSLKFW